MQKLATETVLKQHGRSILIDFEFKSRGKEIAVCLHKLKFSYICNP